MIAEKCQFLVYIEYNVGHREHKVGFEPKERRKLHKKVDLVELDC
jgi:hypothetical protein